MTPIRPEDLREKVARIADPEMWKVYDYNLKCEADRLGWNTMEGMRQAPGFRAIADKAVAVSLERADAILSLLSSIKEGGGTEDLCGSGTQGRPSRGLGERAATPSTLQCEPMVPDEDGWSEWIHPLPGYLMQCCDCGLIHEMEHAIGQRVGDGALNDGEDEDGVVLFRARRWHGSQSGGEPREGGSISRRTTPDSEFPSGEKRS